MRGLMAVTPGTLSVEETVAKCRAIAPYVDYIQVREKQKSAREQWMIVQQLADVIPTKKLIINDRLDVALLVPQLYGVQLGYTSVTAEQARQLNEQWRIGSSIHGEHERTNADYYIYGHVYETKSKSGLAGRGIDSLREIIGQSDRPIMAIGGITPARVAEVMATGAAGIAVLSPLFYTEDSVAAAQQYRAALQQWEMSDNGRTI